MAKNCKLFPPNWPCLALLITFLYHFIKHLLWWSPLLPLTMNHVAWLVIVFLKSQCIHKIWKIAPMKISHCRLASVCMCVHCCLSVHKGVCLPCCVCLVTTTWCELHVVSCLTPDVHTQHLQVMFTCEQSDSSMRHHSSKWLSSCILSTFVSSPVLYASDLSMRHHSSFSNRMTVLPHLLNFCILSCFAESKWTHFVRGVTLVQNIYCTCASVRVGILYLHITLCNMLLYIVHVLPKLLF